jgi:Trk K+ transport system NAD-binding subunit
LGVFLKKSEGIMIIGGSRVSRLIAAYLQKNNRRVVLIDSNKANVEKAKELGIDALSANIYNDDLSDNIELSDMGYLLSMTGNDVINRYAMDKLGKDFGENGTYRLISSEELRSKKTKSKDLFCATHDYLDLMRVAEAFPSIQEVQASTQQMYTGIIDLINDNQDAIALFVKTPEGVISLVDGLKDTAIEENTTIAYIGRPMDFEDVMTAQTQEPLPKD